MLPLVLLVVTPVEPVGVPVRAMFNVPPALRVMLPKFKVWEAATLSVMDAPPELMMVLPANAWVTVPVLL